MGNKFFYTVKPLVPRSVQLSLRRMLVRRALHTHADTWPIFPGSESKPTNWQGWPEGKKFAFILTHDVDTQKGHDASIALMELEKNLGFISSFNFVPQRYRVLEEVRKTIAKNGFEIGVHGLTHDGKLFSSREIFQKRCVQINNYLKEWEAVGFRAPSMIRNLEWIKEFDIEYDASTFDTDPFEPQPENMKTIFPFWISASDINRNGYVELPYTLCQDFSLFVLLGNKDNSVWKAKLDWIAENGGMALINTHPDYMNFTHRRCKAEEYPVSYYADFITYVQSRYANEYWNVLPKDIARFFKKEYVDVELVPKHNAAKDRNERHLYENRKALIIQ